MSRTSENVSPAALKPDRSGRVRPPALGLVVIADSDFVSCSDDLVLMSQILEQVHCFLFAQSDVLGEDLPHEARRNRC